LTTQKGAAQRWQNGDGKSKELSKTTTDLVEDEKDPDVIPHGKKTEKSTANATSVHYGELLPGRAALSGLSMGIKWNFRFN
jgi:hypothetical protein